MHRNGMRPVHPGEVLREDYLEPLGMSANALANALCVTAARINDIVRERRGVSADTALRLARYFGGAARGVKQHLAGGRCHTVIGARLTDNFAPALLAFHRS